MSPGSSPQRSANANGARLTTRTRLPHTRLQETPTGDGVRQRRLSRQCDYRTFHDVFVGGTEVARAALRPRRVTYVPVPATRRAAATRWSDSATRSRRTARRAAIV